jgi:hypothetical protein
VEARFACGSMVRFLSFSQNMCSESTCFVKKMASFPKRMLFSALPEANRCIGVEHRVNRVSNRSYAVAHPKGNFASGRAEEIRSFSRKNSQREFFREKETSVPPTLPQAKYAVIGSKRLIWMHTAYVVSLTALHCQMEKYSSW